MSKPRSRTGRPRNEAAASAIQTPEGIVTEAGQDGNTGLLKDLKHLPSAPGGPHGPHDSQGLKGTSEPHGPPLEAEPAHRRLARLNREHTETTEALRELKRTWMERNLKAQQLRTPIATPEITHVENQKRELAAKLLSLQTQIGQTNKEIREQKALRQAPAAHKGNGSKPTKKCPIKEHRAFDQYFRLAAENELEAGLYGQIDAAARVADGNRGAMNLPEFILEKLSSCPTAGNGVNRWLFIVSRHLHAHLDQQTIYELLRERTRHCGRTVKDAEIIRQITSSRAVAWSPLHPEAFLHAGDLEEVIVARPSPPPWPEANPEVIRAIVAAAWGLYALWERSPVRLENGHNQAEAIIDSLFPGNPLLCCAKSAYQFATRRREVWRGHFARLAFIVPNPMLHVTGHTQNGKLSEHSKEATAARVYLVVEFDFSRFARDGVTLTNWAPLIDEWDAAGITVADACAALHLHLAERLPLVVAVSSGGKSLHAWYAAYNQTEKQLHEFMEYAVSLGADRQLWVRSQFSRVPDGRRENGNHQTTYYFDPAKAVKA